MISYQFICLKNRLFFSIMSTEIRDNLVDFQMWRETAKKQPFAPKLKARVLFLRIVLEYATYIHIYIHAAASQVV